MSRPHQTRSGPEAANLQAVVGQLWVEVCFFRELFGGGSIGFVQPFAGLLKGAPNILMGVAVASGSWGSWGGRRPSLADSVTVTGARGG